MESKLRIPAARWCEPQSLSCLPSPTHPCHSAMDWSVGRPAALHSFPKDWCAVTPLQSACHPQLSSCLSVSTGMHSSVQRIRRSQEDTLPWPSVHPCQSTKILSFSRWLIIAPHVQCSSKDALESNTDYYILYGGSMYEPTLNFKSFEMTARVILVISQIPAHAIPAGSFVYHMTCMLPRSP